ncbi:tryptophan--tRNA ligase [Paenibacillus tepidiphilus]|uniref:tryptophan--tRNA ligase n=1 Tax=Paenibacillus tepidiphilus TaxID=2608683 RepID=UPI0012387B0B|nr:hypothetical protein [Paenibacillus tepidiphilus]
MKKIILTGIRATGLPHIGNYYGSIKPLLSLQDEYRIFQLIADLHAIPTVRDQALMNGNVRSVTACYLACGLDIKKSVLWRQSQITEMAWLSMILLSLVSVEELNAEMNLTANTEKDMISSLYPVLMAADTLMMGADLVFAGRDHESGLAFVRQLAHKFNLLYGDILQEPEPIFPGLQHMVRGLDGRKMSKSFDNTISLIDSKEVLYKKIFDIEGETREESLQILMDLLSLTGSAAVIDKGMDADEAKLLLFEEMNRELEPIRQKYHELMQQPEVLDDVLQQGLAAAETQARGRIDQILDSAGLSTAVRNHAKRV